MVHCIPKETKSSSTRKKSLLPVVKVCTVSRSKHNTKSKFPLHYENLSLEFYPDLTIILGSDTVEWTLVREDFYFPGFDTVCSTLSLEKISLFFSSSFSRWCTEHLFWRPPESSLAERPLIAKTAVVLRNNVNNLSGWSLSRWYTFNLYFFRVFQVNEQLKNSI